MMPLDSARKLAYANIMRKISELAPGQGGIIRRVGGEGEFRDRLLDMGLTPGTHIFLRKTAPLGDPLQLSLRGYELTIRKADASRISISPMPEAGSGQFRPCYGDCRNCIIQEDIRAERPVDCREDNQGGSHAHHHEGGSHAHHHEGGSHAHHHKNRGTGRDEPR